jgi:hypothetical protein
MPGVGINFDKLGRSGENERQLTPIKLNGFNDEKVIQISRGLWH